MTMKGDINVSQRPDGEGLGGEDHHPCRPSSRNFQSRSEFVYLLVIVDSGSL